MKKQKVLSCLLAVQMLMGTSFVANAEGESTKLSVTNGYAMSAWKGPYFSDNTNQGCAAGVTIDDKRSGDTALLMSFPTERPTNYMYLQNPNAVTLTAGKEYVMGAWVKTYGEKSKGSLYLGVSWDRVELNKAKETKDGWTLYEGKFTPTADRTDKVWLVADKVCGTDFQILVDDVYIKESGKNENIVDDAGFEGYLKEQSKISKGRDAIRISDKWREYSQISGDNFYMQPVDGAGHVYEGEKAVYLRRNNASNATELGLAKLEGTFDVSSLPNGKKYTVTMYLKGTPSKENQVYFGTRKSTKRLSECTKEYAGDGWYKYSYQFTEAASDDNFFQFYLSKYLTNESLYIDGFSVKDEQGNEYFSYGGFEDCFVYDVGEPRRFVAYSASSVNKGKGVVSWLNPNMTATNITLEVDGEVVEFTPNLASGAYNKVVLDNLIDGQSYDVVLKISDNKRTYKFNRYLVANSNINYYPVASNRFIDGDGWTLLKNETEGNYCETVLDIDNDIKYSGNSSMRITSGGDSMASGVYSALVQTVTLKKNTRYKFSAQIKYIGAGSVSVQGIYNTSNGWMDSPAISYNNRDRWKNVSYEIDAVEGDADDSKTYTKNLMFLFNKGVDAVWIDDVSICPIVEGEVDTTANCIRNGGFEYDTEWEVRGYSYQETFMGEPVGEELEGLVSGNVLGSIKIRNYSEEGLGVAVVAALYENGKLIDMSFVEQDIPVIANPYALADIGAAVTVPEMTEGNEYEMKLMLWDSVGNLQPLAQPYSLK